MFKSLLLCAIPLWLSVSIASADTRARTDADFNFAGETGFSTLGRFVAPDMKIRHRLHIRVPVFFRARVAQNPQNRSVNEMRDIAESANVMADYYLGRRGFRLSGGLSVGSYEIRGQLTNPTVNGQTYFGRFDVEARQVRRFAPVVAFGYRSAVRKRANITAEIGARMSSLSLRTTGQERLSAADRAKYRSDLRQVNEDLKSFQAIPFISIGARFQF